jgi:hypothetical protein
MCLLKALDEQLAFILDFNGHAVARVDFGRF